jgi:ubiquinone/menaquinone biosynthesis C-methylase UbiE
MSTEQKVNVWNSVWVKNFNRYKWEYLAQVILETLQQEIKGHSKEILEAGSGSGKISLKLSKLDGHKPTLLDLSAQALFLSTQLNQASYHIKDVHFLNGSLFHIPIKNESYDIVWNAGVLEHFLEDEQARALKEMARVLKPEGLIIMLNPFAGSILHSIGKFIIERLVEYPFGREIPIQTLKHVADSVHLELKKQEYSVGFILLWVGAIKRLMLLPGGIVLLPLFKILNAIFCWIHTSPMGDFVRKLDLFLSRRFGGYLLVSVIGKKL